MEAILSIGLSLSITRSELGNSILEEINKIIDRALALLRHLDRHSKMNPMYSLLQSHLLNIDTIKGVKKGKVG